MTIRLLCASHTPLMDHVEAPPEVEQEVRGTFGRLGEEVRAYDPELLIIFSPDHFRGFFYDMLPPFTVGIRATAIGDYGIGEGDYDVPEALALQCVEHLHANDVDVAMSYRMRVDHGFSQVPVLLTGSVRTYPTIPIHINCAGPPLPSIRRVRELGHQVGRWAAGLGKRVLIVGSGGLSHDPPIPRIGNAPPHVAEMLIAGRNPSQEALKAREQANFELARKLARGEGDALPLNPDWDRAFMAQMAEGDFAPILATGDDALTAIAGCGGHEVRTWVAAYAAMHAAGPGDHRFVYYHAISEWNAGMGIATAAAAAQA
ncbi:3-carboxyethylcatechol 2,3-dioxygenase [Sphingomonas canadensis]|uniref:3-carboxyethylcatechol 2,3-dioxygenase n=1 Tax=Sphingomonas canadensis TaxID=1219257 RepID=A0ABW3HDP7_9SPHN|nr:3-carboxyethylcatechol 2,3-dioxygenase [Sphingomonas canadensis]MCW3838128.1 3-carboxyethylcatechol 2,3-dioxygenase [Sphingomonas canadensis]